MRHLLSLPLVWARVRADLLGEIGFIREFCVRRLAAFRRRDYVLAGGADRSAPTYRSTAPAPLFRTQVADARRDQWLGEAQLVHPLPIRVVVGVCLALTMATLLFAVFGTYTRRVHAEGMLARTSA